MSEIPDEKRFDEVQRELERQDRVHPVGYPATRDGVRLGLAAAEDEVREALDAWREGRCKCHTPNCDHADWTETRGEIVQAIAVLLRIMEAMDWRTDRLLAAREERLKVGPIGGI